MCLFIETIRIEKGKAVNLSYHEQRLNATYRHIFGNILPAKEICLANHVCPAPDMDNMKCRVIYGRNGITEITYTPYIIRPIRSLRMVYDDDIEYAYKSTDRTFLNRLFARRGQQDDILIIRHGLLTDTSIANIALFDGAHWHTPCHPLLQGTCRASLIDLGVLHEADITPDMLSRFSRARLFNAMTGWGTVELDTKDIL